MNRRNSLLVASLLLALSSFLVLFGSRSEAPSIPSGEAVEGGGSEAMTRPVSGATVSGISAEVVRGVAALVAPGRRARFAIDLGLSTRAKTAQGSKISGDLESGVRLRGEVEVTNRGVLSGRGSYWFRFDDLVLEVMAGGTRTPMKGKDLGGVEGVEILVSTDPEGRFDSISVPASIDRDREDFLRGILSRFQLVDRSDVRSTWTVAEESDLGRVSVRYRKTEGGRYDKSIESFERVALLGISEQSRIEGSVRIELDGSRSVIRMVGEETVRSGSEESGFLHMVRSTSIVRIESGSAIAGSVSSLRTFPMAMSNEDGRANSSSREEIEGVALEDVLEDLREEFGVNPEGSMRVAQLLDRLVLLCRHRTGLAGMLSQAIESESVEVRRVLIAALGAAGTPEAQEAVASLFLDGEREDGLRMDALTSAFQVARPTRELVEAVDFLSQEAASDRLRGSSILLLGTLAGRCEGDIQEEILQGLDRQVVGRPGDVQAQGLYLQALANSGTEEAPGRVIQYLANENEMVRMTAVSALGRLGGEGSRQALVRSSRKDSSNLVRSSALQELARRFPRSETTRDALEAAGSDPSPMVRKTARTILDG